MPQPKQTDTASRATETKPRSKRASAAEAPYKLHLLVTIVKRSKADYYMDLLQQTLEVNLQLSALAEGTANLETLRLMGLTDAKKVVLFSVVRDDKLPAALALLEEKFQTIRKGKGVAFTVPLTSVVGVTIYQFLSNNRMTKEG